jgi:hypothetical protein
MTQNPTPASPTSSNSITTEWRHNRRMIVLTAGKLVGQETIDHFYHTLYTVAVSWPDNRPFAALIQNQTFNWSPYIRKRAEETLARLPDRLSGRLAFLMPPTSLNHLVAQSLLTINKQAKHKIEISIFTLRDIAEEWLSRILEEAEA